MDFQAIGCILAAGVHRSWLINWSGPDYCAHSLAALLRGSVTQEPPPERVASAQPTRPAPIKRAGARA